MNIEEMLRLQTWTLCSITAEGMISDPKSLDVAYFDLEYQ